MLHLQQLFKRWSIIRIYNCRHSLLAQLILRLHNLYVCWLWLFISHGNGVPIAVESEVFQARDIEGKFFVANLVLSFVLLHHGLETFLTTQADAKLLLDLILELFSLLVVLVHEPLEGVKWNSSWCLFVLILDRCHEAGSCILGGRG